MLYSELELAVVLTAGAAGVRLEVDPPERQAGHLVAVMTAGAAQVTLTYGWVSRA